MHRALGKTMEAQIEIGALYIYADVLGRLACWVPTTPGTRNLSFNARGLQPPVPTKSQAASSLLSAFDLFRHQPKLSSERLSHGALKNSLLTEPHREDD